MNPTQKAEADKLAKEWMGWFETELYDQPIEDAWDPAYLEYQCATSAPDADKEKILTADEYYSGHLDWSSFDIDNKKETLGETEPQQSRSRPEQGTGPVSCDVVRRPRPRGAPAHYGQAVVALFDAAGLGSAQPAS